jgi:hypothetical protein
VGDVELFVVFVFEVELEAVVEAVELEHGPHLGLKKVVRVVAVVEFEGGVEFEGVGGL